MRTYGEYCAVAKSLDVVGDRWTLLIVRELLLRGDCRYTDLRGGLPGIATNLLADRLRELEQAGIVTREQAPPPIATTLFRLTRRGRELEIVLHELGRWGLPYMEAGPAPGDEFRGHWLSWPVELFMSDTEPDGPPVRIAVQVGDEDLTVQSTPTGIEVHPGRPDDPDLTLSGPPHAVLGILSGRMPLSAARKRGLRASGDLAALRRLQPQV